MLRADMDALPIAENTGLAYASKVSGVGAEGNTVPVGHMCGHDMHVTWLVGAEAEKFLDLSTSAAGITTQGAPASRAMTLCSRPAASWRSPHSAASLTVDGSAPGARRVEGHAYGRFSTG
jgi:hypothetical protein